MEFWFIMGLVLIRDLIEIDRPAGRPAGGAGSDVGLV